jgi:hypothetical protein
VPAFAGLSLCEKLRDKLAVCGVQRISPMIAERGENWWGDIEETANPPHDTGALRR